jgi:serine/threonine protein kinase
VAWVRSIGRATYGWTESLRSRFCPIPFRRTRARVCGWSVRRVGTHEDQTYLVMEYLEGDTIAERLASKPLSLPDALALGVQIARALHAAYRAGLVHRDLKPANVMLVKHGSALHTKLLDFGIAKTLPRVVGGERPGESLLPTANAAVTGQGMLVGTVQYMAPEQLEGRDVDARTDIFSFGALLYEMVTGRKGLRGEQPGQRDCLDLGGRAAGGDNTAANRATGTRSDRREMSREGS